MLKKFSGSILYVLISVLVISLYIDRHESFEKLDRSIQDSMMKWRGPKEVPSDIAIVGIDDMSLKEWGPWPWNRDKFAQLVNNMASQNPKTIVLDMAFGTDSVQSAMGYTESLSRVLADARNIVIGYNYSQNDIPANGILFPDGLARSAYVNFDDPSKFATYPPMVASRIYPPENALANSAAQMGFRNINIDNDRKVRQQALIVGFRGEFFPSLQIAAAADFLRLRRDQINVQIGDAIMLGQNRISTDRRGKLNINFYGPQGTFKYYSAAEIIKNTIPRGELSQKLILVGYVGMGTTDIFSSTTSTRLSGLELDANIIENILHGTYLHRAVGPLNFSFLILIAIGIICALILPRLALIYRIIVLSGLLIALSAFNYYLFTSLNFVLSTFYPALEIVIFLAAAPIIERRKEMVSNAREDEEEVDYASLLSSSQSMPVDNWTGEVPKSQYGQTKTAQESSSNGIGASSGPTVKVREKDTGTVAVADAPTADHFGRYKVMKPIGKGAMGMVYKGLDPAIDRLVALKTIRVDHLAEADEVDELRRRLILEAKAAGKLSHPNIVTIYDVGEEGTMQYIAMEYLQGQTLESMLKKGLDWDYRTLSKVMIQACEALDYAHENGIVHRDIKPANIMILEGNKVKVMDFGIARFDKSGSRTEVGTALGTPNYISPEQLKGQPVDRRSDIFSLGVVFYEILTGEKPFKGDTISALIYSILHTEPLRPSEINLDIPRIFDKIVAKAMVKDPDVRFQCARDIADILRKLI
jgi:CHASE2 domain-containing sensor protein/tRNA A-37 threonylcarbamoyl transferase component Bud32